MEITQVASKDASQLVTDAAPGCLAASQITHCPAVATMEEHQCSCCCTTDTSKRSGLAADFMM